MTEAAANVVENVVPDTQAPLTPQEQAQNTKAALQMGLHQQYLQLINFLNNIPGHPQLKMHCFQNLDQAGFWAREFIQSANLLPPVPVAPPTEATNPVSIPDNVTPITDSAPATE
jgi:hypothetical protein